MSHALSLCRRPEDNTIAPESLLFYINRCLLVLLRYHFPKLCEIKQNAHCGQWGNPHLHTLYCVVLYLVVVTLNPPLSGHLRGGGCPY